MANVTGITLGTRRQVRSTFTFELRDYPEHPGCYLLRDADGALLYVGKAKNLRRRMASYFHNSGRPHRKEEMIQRIRGIDIFLCRNEREALVLECNLIQHHRPPYNGKLSREGEGYYYIARTGEAFPRFVPYRRERANYALENVDGEYAELFGPFTGWTLRNRLLEVIRSRFALRACHALPDKACARAQTGGCRAPCEGGISAADYRTIVAKASRVLRRPPRSFVRTMRCEMADAAARQDFDRARALRDRIRALEHAALPQATEIDRPEDLDVLWVGDGLLTSLLVRGGRVIEIASTPLGDRRREKRHLRTPPIVANDEARDFLGFARPIRVPRSTRGRHGALLEICRLNHAHRADTRERKMR